MLKKIDVTDISRINVEIYINETHIACMNIEININRMNVEININKTITLLE